MIAPLALFLFFLLVYIPGVSPTVYGGDTGDIIISYFFGNIAHSPGYPLNTMLGWLLTHFFGFLSSPFAYKADLVSAIYQALTCVLVFLFMRRITKNSLIALFTAFTLGFSSLFWLYAHVAEVFQLTLLLISISFFFMVSEFLNKEKEKNRKKYFLGIFIWGLAVFHHLTAVLLAPAYLFILWKERKILFVNKIDGFKILGAFFAGLLPYLYAVYQSFAGNLQNWENTLTANDLFRLITRADYGSFSATRDLIGLTFQSRIFQFLWYFKFILADFNILGLMLALAGSVFLYLKKRDFFWVTFLAWFFCGPFFFFYASFPLTDSFFKGVAERFLLNSYIFVAVFAGFGLYGLVELLRVYAKSRFLIHSSTLKILTLGFFILPLSLVFLRFSLVNLGNYKLGGIFARDILLSADPPGILIIQGDTSSFNVAYNYWIERENPKSKVISLGRLGRPTYRQSLMKLYPDLTFPDSFYSKQRLVAYQVASDLIDLNIYKFPIYLFEPLELPNGQYVSIRAGMLNRLYLKNRAPGADEVVNLVKQKTSEISFRKDDAQGYLQFFPDNIVTEYTQVLTENGDELLRRGKIEESREYFLKVLDLNGQDKYSNFRLGVSFLEAGDCEGGLKYFNKVIAIDPDYWHAWLGLGQTYKDCYKDEMKAKTFFDKSVEIQKKSDPSRAPIN